MRIATRVSQVTFSCFTGSAWRTRGLVVPKRKAWNHKTARSAVFLFAASDAKFSKRDIGIASERAFSGVLGHFFGCSTPFHQKMCFSTQGFTRFLSTVLSQRRATRSDVSFQTKESECFVMLFLT